MQSSTTWAMSSIDTTKKDTSLLSLLFFMMGAMNVYIFLRRQRNWLNQQGLRFLRIGFVSLTCAALLEVAVF
jgi:hypothetical protein